MTKLSHTLSKLKTATTASLSLAHAPAKPSTKSPTNGGLTFEETL